MAIAIFSFFVALVVGLSFYLGARAKSAQGYFAAGGGIHWFVNGIAFAGDYLSAASFLGICGMIAFYGYDGFLYSIGYLAGWIVALFVVAEPLKRLGRYTFADALDNKFQSRGIKLAAAISTLIVSIFYLIPQMVGAGTLVQPLLGLEHYQGVICVGIVVILIVVTAGMVSTTWVQFIKGSLLVFFCTILTVMILNRGLTTQPKDRDGKPLPALRTLPEAEVTQAPGVKILAPTDGWIDGDKPRPYVRVQNAEGIISVWRKTGTPEKPLLSETQYTTEFNDPGKKKLINGTTDGKLSTFGHLKSLPEGKTETGPLGPFAFFTALQGSEVLLPANEVFYELPGTKESQKKDVKQTIYYEKPVMGKDFMTPGSSPTFAGVRSEDFVKKLDFLSLMLAIFCGTASLPHILIRYYTVKDQASARKSTVVGIAAIGFFYILTLYMGFGAMTSGSLNTNSNMAAPLLARSFSEVLFAIISAIAFTTVLGTVSGLIMAASGAVAHDLMSNFFKMELNDYQKVRAAKMAAVGVGIIAIVLGILFKNFNVTFLVGWAFNIAASANLPALVMLLFWKRTTKQGITAGIVVGLLSSLGWVLLSKEACKDLYGMSNSTGFVPFSQPAIVTIPLGFLVLIVVSLLTKKPEKAKA